MKYQVLLKNQLKNEGASGLYFRTSRRTGVKILKNSGFLLKEFNLNHKKNQVLIQEATIGILAEQLTKGIGLFKYRNKFHLGIIQKHFYSKPKNLSEKLLTKELIKLKKEINKKKVVHSDFHLGNILWNPLTNDYKVIDFDPKYAYFVGKKNLYYKVKNLLIRSIKKDLRES